MAIKTLESIFRTYSETVYNEKSYLGSFLKGIETIVQFYQHFAKK